MKRIINILVAGAMIVAFVPILVLLAVAVKVASRGPAFYRGVPDV